MSKRITKNQLSQIYSKLEQGGDQQLTSDEIGLITDALRESLEEQTDDDFSSSYKDPFQTSEQSERDSTITQLLNAYYDSYLRKGVVKRYCQLGICGICSVFVFSCLIGLLFLTSQISFHPEKFSDIGSMVGFCSAFVSFSGLIFGLAKIITKYAFPKNDEQYITDIVKAIQENDFNTIVESHKAQTNSTTPTELKANLTTVESDNDM